MATFAQINANRANAQHCTGPKTPDGKAASSRNATKHGLTSTRVLIPGEDPAEFEAMRERFHAEYQPETETEHTLTDLVAETKWRLLRAQRMEAEATARLLAEPQLATLLIIKFGNYVSGIARDLSRFIGQLRKIRAERLKVQEAEYHADAMKRSANNQREFGDAIAEIRSQMRSTSSTEFGFVSPTGSNDGDAAVNDAHPAADQSQSDVEGGRQSTT